MTDGAQRSTSQPGRSRAVTYARALQQAYLGAEKTSAAYIYRLINGSYYVSDLGPAFINAQWVSTVRRSHVVGSYTVEAAFGLSWTAYPTLRLASTRE